MSHAQTAQLAQAHRVAQLTRFQPARPTAGDVRRAVDQLPLSIDSLQALCSIVEGFAYALYKEPGYVNADVVHAHLVDAFEAVDKIEVKS